MAPYASYGRHASRPHLSDSIAHTDIVTSLRAYFEAGMHIDRAAKRLFVHPNTLRNRLARFETLANVNLRDPRPAFEVWRGTRALQPR